MATVQQHLNQFYIELQAWIDGGCGEHPVFAKSRSVCGAALEWQRINRPEIDGIWTLWNAISGQFEDAGLHRKHPFNGESFADWEFESDLSRLYTNPARLAWIKEHADAAKAAGQEAA